MLSWVLYTQLKPMKLASISAAPDLVEQVYSSLLEAICSSELAPGQRITQEALAEQLGVSRQPVLQALKLLQGEGLIYDTPNKKGMIVATLDASFVSNLYSIRAALDGLAARSAASFSRIDIRGEGIEIMRNGRNAAAQGDLKALVAAVVTSCWNKP
jgi:DNA-binding GntR family transcriptional regulator